MTNRLLPLIVLLATASTGAVVSADTEPVEPGERKTAQQKAEKASATRAAELLATLESATSEKQRLEAAKELIDQSPPAIDTLETFLARSHTAGDKERRAILKAIKADVPNKKGKFRMPGRQTKDQVRRDDAFDWLAELAKLSDRSGLGEVIADIAVIRALTSTKVPRAAGIVLDFAFSTVGIVYRDECGRYLRKMSPYSLPPLIVASELRGKRRPKGRYATYQLERLDRENPYKAFADGVTDELTIEILKAFRDSLYREAVYTVLDNVNHHSTRIRTAARAAWMEYATGRPPAAAPKKKLVLPGGKLSDKKQPLWLNSRELAAIALKRRLEEVTGNKPDADDLGKLSKKLFAHYDGLRAKEVAGRFEAAKKDAKAGKLAEATAVFDAILVEQPLFEYRNQMAPYYYEFGQTLEKESNWREASAAYGKAHAMAPDGEVAADALAKHHFTRGKALQEQGEDGATEFALAADVERTAHDGDGSSKSWMLIVGLAGAAGGLLLLFLGFQRRRRHSPHAYQAQHPPHR